MKYFVLLLIVVSIYACGMELVNDPIDNELQSRLENLSPTGDIHYFALPDSDELDLIPQSSFNPLTTEKVALGKLLFYETALAGNARHESGKGTYSCSTCHIPKAGFMPGREQGIADGGWGFGLNGESRIVQPNYNEEEIDVQGARPLSLLNVAYVTNTTWTGKFGANHVNEGTEFAWDLFEDTDINHLGMDGIESQLIEGLALHRFRVDEYILDEIGYRAYFDAAFSDVSDQERYAPKTVAFALAAYIRTLLPTEAPFQQWVKGDFDAMSVQQKRGALLFYDKAGCFRCHKGPALSSVEFYAIGVHDLWQSGGLNTDANELRNKGRGGFTQKTADLYKFKVPSIYNMYDSPFYFHGSSKRTLRGVVEYFNNGIKENQNVPESFISPFFHPLDLSELEMEDLTKFLKHGLRDPNLTRFAPEAVLSGNCFPNNDLLSQSDLGCE